MSSFNATAGIVGTVVPEASQLKPSLLRQSLLSATIIRNASFLACFATILALVCSRLLTSVASRSKAQDGDAVRVPSIPYFIPFLGNAPRLFMGFDNYLKSLRDSSTEGLFSLKLFGTTHNLILSPTIAARIFARRAAVFDHEPITWFFMNVVGGVPTSYQKMVMDAVHSIESLFSMLMREPHLSKMVSINCRNMELALPNMVSFAASLIDQYPWERRSESLRIVDEDGQPCAEASLLPLIVDFIGHAATPSIFGTDLLRNFPNLLSDLWAFNSGFFYLAANLPRWFPLAKVTRAHAGRKRVMEALCAQQAALDDHADGREPGEGWSNIADVSDFIKARHKMWREKNIPVDGRAELSMLWALNANSNFAVFWLLLRIFLTPGLLERVRGETAEYARVSYVKTSFGNEERQLSLDERSLTTACPLLKSSLIESMRLDCSTWSLKRLGQDITVQGDQPSTSANNAQTGITPSYHLKAGSFIEVPMDLHFSDRKYFPNPDQYIPDRHIRPATEPGLSPTAEWGTVRAFGGGSNACKGRLYAEKEILTAVAGILALWDFEPVDPAGWKLPRHGMATGVSMPKDDVRVRISRRPRV